MNLIKLILVLFTIGCIIQLLAPRPHLKLPESKVKTYIYYTPDFNPEDYPDTTPLSGIAPAVFGY